ncbi:LysR family transcriptional regulator [Brevundimonas faecalis]|uniref:DNA-binding transcriptional LysR family regulator n=1 Tax=Brevundimonas faecalis TaxID=947378 RepID=A0ABV2RCH3_9CAUL
MSMDDIGPGGAVRVFLSVCEHGGFARAADDLGLTPSAVAKAIARLESRLKVRLFDRTTRRFAVTQEGAAYHAVCSAAVAAIRRVERDMVSSAAEPVGLVRISMPPLFGAEVIAPALFELADRHPRLDYELSLSGEPVDLLSGGHDLAVRIGEPPDVAGVKGRLIGEQRLTLCASVAYLERAGRPTSWRDLAGHDLIASARRGRIAPWRFREDGAEVSWTPTARLVLDGAALSLAAVRAGRGIGLAPTWLVARDVAEGRLVSVLEDQVAGHRPVYLLWAETPVLIPRLRATIDAVAEAAAAVVGR